MTFSDNIKILRRQELDAFIAQAFSADLMNTQYLQDLQVPRSTRLFKQRFDFLDSRKFAQKDESSLKNI